MSPDTLATRDRSYDGWLTMNPSTAFTAGLPVEVERALDLERHAAAALGSLSRATALDLSREERAVLVGARAQAAAFRPAQPVREALEWIRALIYLERLGTAAAASDDTAIASRLPDLMRRCLDGTLPERILVRSMNHALGRLAWDAGLRKTAAASKAADAILSRVPVDPSWQELETARVTDLRGAIEGEAYEQLLRDSFGVTEPIEVLDRRIEAALSEECYSLGAVARECGRLFAGAPATPEEVMTAIERTRTAPDDALAVATRMTLKGVPALGRHIIRLEAEDEAVRPEATPAAMVSLITEGEEYLAGGLTSSRRAHCFITPAKCGSLYTLANVLFHELAHCWNMLRASRESEDLPAGLHIAGSLGTVLIEGIATLREREVYELYGTGEGGPEYDALFSVTGLPIPVARREFELDTRYWWTARLVRALFDFRVQSGRQTYAEFVPEMSARIGLSRERVHGFCFSFFERPGYACSYAMGAVAIDALRRECTSEGMSRREFNTRLSGIGMVPPAFWASRVRSAALRAVAPVA